MHLTPADIVAFGMFIIGGLAAMKIKKWWIGLAMMVVSVAFLVVSCWPTQKQTVAPEHSQTIKDSRQFVAMQGVSAGSVSVTQDNSTHNNYNAEDTNLPEPAVFICTNLNPEIFVKIRDLMTLPLPAFRKIQLRVENLSGVSAQNATVDFFSYLDATNFIGSGWLAEPPGFGEENGDQEMTIETTLNHWQWQALGPTYIKRGSARYVASIEISTNYQQPLLRSRIDVSAQNEASGKSITESYRINFILK